MTATRRARKAVLTRATKRTILTGDPTMHGDVRVSHSNGSVAVIVDDGHAEVVALLPRRAAGHIVHLLTDNTLVGVAVTDNTGCVVAVHRDITDPEASGSVVVTATDASTATVRFAPTKAPALLHAFRRAVYGAVSYYND